MNSFAMPEQIKESDRPKLFLVEARNCVERKYLLDRLLRIDGVPSSKKLINWVRLPSSEQETVFAISDLAEKLKAHPETMVVPVRAAWQLLDSGTNSTSKIRHLLLGDPRLPGNLRAWSILKREPNRAHSLIGEPASIQALKQRFEEQDITGDLTRNEVFASFVIRQAGLTLDICERGLQGQRYKAPRFVAASLTASPKFRTAMNALSIKLEKPESELYKEAGTYMRELISRPSALFIDIKARIDRFMLSQGYEEEVVFDQSQLAIC